MNSIFLRAAVTLFAAALATLALAQMRQPGDDAPPKPLPPQQKNFPLDQTWSLRDINDKPVPAGLDASLKIDGNLRGSGYTGCNSWSATLYPVKDQHLLLGPYALTKKQCAKDVMAVEFGFLSALTGSPTWDLVNGDLVIKGPEGIVAARPLALSASAAALLRPPRPARTSAGPSLLRLHFDAPLMERRERRVMADRDQRRLGQFLRDGAIDLALRSPRPALRSPRRETANRAPPARRAR